MTVLKTKEFCVSELHLGKEYRILQVPWCYWTEHVYWPASDGDKITVVKGDISLMVLKHQLPADANCYCTKLVLTVVLICLKIKGLQSSYEDAIYRIEWTWYEDFTVDFGSRGWCQYSLEVCKTNVWRVDWYPEWADDFKKLIKTDETVSFISRIGKARIILFEPVISWLVNLTTPNRVNWSFRRTRNCFAIFLYDKAGDVEDAWKSSKGGDWAIRNFSRD